MADICITAPRLIGPEHIMLLTGAEPVQSARAA